MSEALTATYPGLARYQQAGTRDEALKVFFDVLGEHADKVSATVKRAEDIYAFRTPDRPFFQYDVQGVSYGAPAEWAQSPLDHALHGELQWNLFNLEAIPESDFVASLQSYGAGPNLIPELFGVEFEQQETEVITVFHPKAPVVRDLATDIDRLLDIAPEDTDHGRAAAERTRFLAEMTEGRIDFVYPQLGGPMVNVCRMMSESDALMASIAEPDALHRLVNMAADKMIAWKKMLYRAAGDPPRFRPRRRFYQPPPVAAVMVDDWVSVMGPEQYMGATSEAWRKITDAIGPAFLHTCGPVLKFMDSFLNLPGLAGFEAYFMDGRERTTALMEEAKSKLAGKRVMCALFADRLPNPVIVDDDENLTPEWLREMTEDGGFMLQATGSLEWGRALIKRLGL